MPMGASHTHPVADMTAQVHFLGHSALLSGASCSVSRFAFRRQIPLQQQLGVGTDLALGQGMAYPPFFPVLPRWHSDSHSSWPRKPLPLPLRE